MERVYHLVGLVVVWACLSAVVSWTAYKAYHYIRLNDCWLWIRTYVLGVPWRLEREESVLYLLRQYQAPVNKRTAQWKRNMLARTIRYNRRVGFIPEAF